MKENEATFSSFIEDQENPKYQEICMKTQGKVMTAIEELEEALSINDSSSNMHFYLGLLKTIMGAPQEALESFAMAVDKSDDNYFNHYFWKGVALAMKDQYDQALGEFEIARNIDKSQFKASLNIGTCFLILGDLDNAYEAFKSVVGDPKNEMEVNYCIGKFFMMRGFMNHAVQSFQFALKNIVSEEPLKELVKCYICEKNLVNAMESYAQLEKVAKTAKAKKLYQFDMAVLDSLKKMTEDSMLEAVGDLSKLETQRKDGFIFLRFDLLVYLAIAYALNKDYHSALQTFCIIELEYYTKEEMGLLPDHEEDSFNILFISATEREGQLFIPTRSLTRPELIYNISVCHLMLKQYDKAFLKLTALEMLHQMGTKVSKLLKKLKTVVSPETLQKVVDLKLTSPSPLPETPSDLQNPSMSQESLSKSPLEDFTIFPVENRLCCIYNPIEVSLSEEKSFSLRLSFCLPYILLSDIRITVGFEELQNIDLRKIDYRPEAPWIKKNKENIMFTNNVVEDEVAVYESPQDFLKKVKDKASMPVNTMVRMHVEDAYRHNIEKKKQQMLRKLKSPANERTNCDGEHELLGGSPESFEDKLMAKYDQRSFDYDFSEPPEEKLDINRLKADLMLDPKTTDFLNKLNN